MGLTRTTTTTTNAVPLEVRKGAWTEEEDLLLRNCIHKYGEGKWHQVPFRAGLNRCRKSCRLRWLNYLKPGIKRGGFATDEVDLLVRLHKLLGNRWSLIAGRLPGRTANDVKNYWNTRLQKKMSPHGGGEEARKAKEPKITRANIIRPQPRNFAGSGGGWCGSSHSSAKAGDFDASDQEEYMSKPSPPRSTFPSPSPSTSLCHDQGGSTDDIWWNGSGFDTEIHVNGNITSRSLTGLDDDEQPGMGIQETKPATMAAVHGFCARDGYVDAWSDLLIDVDLWDFLKESDDQLSTIINE